MELTREDVLRGIAIIDRHMAEVVATADVQATWRALRGELRRKARLSESLAPTVATAAQHIARSLEHNERALTALGAARVDLSVHDEAPDEPAREGDEQGRPAAPRRG